MHEFKSSQIQFKFKLSLRSIQDLKIEANLSTQRRGSVPPLSRERNLLLGTADQASCPNHVKSFSFEPPQ